MSKTFSALASLATPLTFSRVLSVTTAINKGVKLGVSVILHKLIGTFSVRFPVYQTYVYTTIAFYSSYVDLYLSTGEVTPKLLLSRVLKENIF